MRRIFLSLTASWAALAAFGQTAWVATRISTQPTGAAVIVDGTEYRGTNDFFWAPGSTHALSVKPEQVEFSAGLRYTFRAWRNSSGQNLGAGTALTLVAGSSPGNILAVFDVEYALSLRLYACHEEDPSLCPDRPGVVFINGRLYNSDVMLWMQPGVLLEVSARAEPGFVFAGWDNAFPDRQAAAQSFAMTGPIELVPQFARAADVRIVTEPAGLRVSINGTVSKAPVSLAPAVGSSLLLRAISPQTDAAGHYWFFDSWSDQGEQEHRYEVKAIVDAQCVTARYVMGLPVGIVTEPPGLHIEVDSGRERSGTNFFWAAGSRHRLVAPSEQTGTDGRRYRFRQWEDGSTDPVREVVASGAAEQAQIFVARYEVLGRVIVESTPPGVRFRIGASECQTPCTLDVAPGGSVEIVPPEAVPVSAGTRWDFAGWEDGAPRERVWTAGSGVERLRAVYRVMHRISTAAKPEGAAEVRLTPLSADGFYVAGSRVVAGVEPAVGFDFLRWIGDTEGTSPLIEIEVNAPKTLIARMRPSDGARRAYVLNAAGPTPVACVAPGSIIAIYGEQLARQVSYSQLGRLPQTLGGVVVSAGERWLPLLYVSPVQINAILPGDIPAGAHSLSIRGEDMAAVQVEFEVCRNAPGLFASITEDTAWAAATGENGRPITPTEPARAGEVITLYGTGFGPFQPAPPDGFPVPAEPQFPLADEVELYWRDARLPVERAVAARAMSGVVAISFRLPENAPARMLLEVKVNGNGSNQVWLAVAP